MLVRKLMIAALLVPSIATSAAAQNADSIIGTVSKAMGAENLNSITFVGTARNGAFGQSADLANPMYEYNVTTVTHYVRTINFGQASGDGLVSRASGPTRPSPTPDVPVPPPGQFNQNITVQQAGAWPQALNIWMTPWGFVKSAAAGSNASVRSQGRQQVVSFSPAGFKSPSGLDYTVTGYINNQNQVTKVETRADHPVVGDLLVEFEYSGYQNMNGVQVPTRIVQKQAGLITSEITVTWAAPNPQNLAELLTPPPPVPGGPPQGPPPAGGPPPQPERLADGVFKIAGLYTSLAIDMGDHILVAESGQSEQRGLAVMAAAKQAIPGKPIRFVTTSHGHFDHASGLPAAIAEGATILTHRNNEAALERFLSGPRTLVGDSLAKVANRRRNVVEPVGDHEVRRGTNGRVVELIHVPNVHTNGNLAVFLPAEKILHAGDITISNPSPAQVGVVRSAVRRFNELNLDYQMWVPVHPVTPERPVTKADVDAVAARTD